MPEFNEGLKELSEEREKHIQSCKKNGDNSYKLLAEDLYNDSAHLLDELLQNADDTKATEACFTFTDEALTITHNGKAFDYRDVEAITGAGSTTKKEGQIGKFGAGFKSVFQITNKPEIHCRNYHFSIEKYIIPEAKSILGYENKKTKIILPFKCGEETEKVKNAIQEKLESFPLCYLLFLQNLKTINIVSKEVKIKLSKHIENISDNLQKITIVKNNDADDEQKETYLIYKKQNEINNKNIETQIAYRQVNDKIKPLSEEEKNPLFVFFPLISQKPDLKFFINIPYKVALNRESFNNESPENKKLTQLAAEMVAETLPLIKEQGWLDIYFFICLPIDNANTHFLYRAIYHEIIKKIQNEPLLPTTNGEYITPQQALIASDIWLQKNLTNDDLKTLGYEGKKWLAPPTLLKTYLKDSFEIQHIDWDDFIKHKKLEALLEKQDNEWLKNFYGKVYEKSNYVLNYILKEKKIIRLCNEKMQAPFVKNVDDEHELQIYRYDKVFSGRYPEFKDMIASDFLPKEKSENVEKEKPELESYHKFFMELLKIQKPAINAIIRKKLKDYNYDKKYHNKDIEIYQSDMAEIKNLIGNSDVDFSFIYKEFYTVPAYKNMGDETIHYLKADDKKLYEKESNLENWFSNNKADEIYFANETKMGELYQSVKESLQDKAILQTRPQISGNCNYKETGYRNHKEGDKKFNPKLMIIGAECAVKKINFEKSIYLWKMLREIISGRDADHVLKGFVYRSKNQNKLKNEENRYEEISEIGKIVLNEPWLYSQDEQLINKSNNDILPDDLHPDYGADSDVSKPIIMALQLKLSEDIDMEEKLKAQGKKIVDKTEWEELQEFKKQKEQKVQEEENTEIIEKDTRTTFPRTNSRNPQTSGNGGGGKSQRTAQAKNEQGKQAEKEAVSYLRKEYPTADVENLNEDGQRGIGYDITVKEKGKIHYYEVKSMTTKNPTSLTLSKAQWECAEQYGECYNIFLLHGFGTDEPKIKIFNNPSKEEGCTAEAGAVIIKWQWN